MSPSDRPEEGPDKARVEELGTPDEKSEPDVFVGREELIASVERNCRRAMTATLKDPATRKNAAGQTFLIPGAPGAGKTSLLSHLKRRWAGKKESPLYPDMGVERLSSLHDVVKEITEFIGRGQPKAIQS